jgi:hypothetical protein
VAATGLMSWAALGFIFGVLSRLIDESNIYKFAYPERLFFKKNEQKKPAFFGPADLIAFLVHWRDDVFCV